VARLDVRDPEKLSYVKQTTLSVDDAAGDRPERSGAVPFDYRAEEGRIATRTQTGRTP